MGHGMCATMAPEVFQVNDETGCNEMGIFQVPDDQGAAVQRGVSACPEQAITVLSGAA